MAEKPVFGKDVQIKIFKPTEGANDFEFDTRELITQLFPAFFSALMDIEGIKRDSLSSAQVFNSLANSLNLDYSVHTSRDDYRVQYVAIGKKDKLFSFMKNPRIEDGQEVYDEHFHMNLIEGNNFDVPADQRVMVRYRGITDENKEIAATNDLQAFYAGLQILQELQSVMPISITNLKS